MRALFRCGGFLVLSLALLIPTFGVAQEKKTPEDSKLAKVKADWRQDIIVFGAISALDDKDDKPLQFTVKFKGKKAEPNPDAAKQLASAQQSLAQHQKQLLQAKKPQDVVNAQNAIAVDLANIKKAQDSQVKYTDFEMDFPFEEEKDFRIRAFEPPVEFDDQGEAIKRTKDELKKLYWADGYPDYKSDKKFLKTGQIVKVFIAKDSPMPSDVAKVIDKLKGKPVDDQTTGVKEFEKNFRYHAIMIWVLKNPPPEAEKK
jgi:hypothetical protein